MSVQVSVDIANGAARRELFISLQTTPTLDEHGHRDLDEVGTYAVVATNGRTRQSRALFKHRYGDDVGVLVARAFDALREEHGAV